MFCFVLVKFCLCNLGPTSPGDGPYGPLWPFVIPSISFSLSSFILCSFDIGINKFELNLNLNLNKPTF